MTEPPRPEAYMCLRQALVVRNAPSRWMASIFFQSAKANCSTGLTIWMPALLTRTSTPPKVSTVLCTAISTCSSSVTSTATPIASAPALLSSAAVDLAASRFRSAIAILAPSRANTSAISLPMPLAAPVTKATLSLRRMAYSLASEVIVHDHTQVQREVGDEVGGGKHSAHRQVGDRCERMGMQFERGRPAPRAFEGDVRGVNSGLARKPARCRPHEE